MLACVLALILAVGDAQPIEYRAADTPRAWSFPADHGAHREYSTEWWYFTGSLEDAEGDAWGFEVTYFRVGLGVEAPAGSSPWRATELILAHLAITDVAGRRFAMAERTRRTGEDIAGAAEGGLELYAGDWTVKTVGDRFEIRARARGKDGTPMRIALDLVPARPPVLHGDGGLSAKDRAGENASHYYTIPRLGTSGTLGIGDDVVNVAGDTWMDHEFFSGDTPADGLGWDWTSLHLDDGRNLMLYRVRHPEHGDYDFGSLMAQDGSARALDMTGVRAEALAHWTSPATGNRYPTAWDIALPAEDIELTVRALLPPQEIDARRSVGFAYWEGLCEAEGRIGADAFVGRGYVELTGYGPDGAIGR